MVETVTARTKNTTVESKYQLSLLSAELNDGTVGGSVDIDDRISNVTCALRREISEKATFSLSRSASRDSARVFICSTNRRTKPS